MLPTRDHDEIKQWALRHGAVPAEIRPLIFDSEPGILHFLMGTARTGTPELHPITWDDFFARFDLMELSFVYDERSPQFELVHVEQTAPVQSFN